MVAPLLSPNWYRVSSLRPRLRAGVRVARHRVRGETWVVLTDPVSGRHHRFDAAAWALVAECDGERTLDDAWAAQARQPRAPTQDEALWIVAQAFQANLLLAEVTPEADAVMRALIRRKRERRVKAVNPLAFRVPLLDPDAWLTRHLAKVGWLYSAGAMVVIAALWLLALMLLLAQGSAFGAHTQALAASTRFWLLLWLLYPAMKAVHELAHAFAVKHFGGEVHTIGITLMLLTPLPYVDASGSSAFPSKWQRAAVAAAGIVAELTLASLALIAWWALEPGLVRDAAVAVVTLCGLSTLLVNGNPLLRFDGYHVVTDVLELPNLAPRSQQWWRALARRRLLGVRGARPPRPAAGETPWLMAYAPLSWVMQCLLLAATVVVTASWNTWVAVALLACAVWLLLAGPAWRVLRWMATARELHGSRARAAFVSASLVIAMALAAIALPLPYRTHAPGLVWLPDDALVRPDTDGFLEQLLVADGAQVQAGTVVARLTNEPLFSQQAKLTAELEQMRIEQVSRFATDAIGSARAGDRITYLQSELERTKARIAALEVRAARAGRWVLDTQRRTLGLHLKQGELLGHVLPEGPALVRAFVHNDHLGLLTAESRTRHAAGPSAPGVAALRGVVHFAHGGQAVPAARITVTPQATRELPSPALGESFGGSIALDTTEREPQRAGRTAAEPRMRVDLELPAGVQAPVGARTLVTFEHGFTTPVDWLATQLRRLFLRHVQPA